MPLRQDLAQIIKESKPSNPESKSFDLDFVFEPNFPIFLGHFPGHPVLPAMVQIIIAEMTLEAWVGKVCKTQKLRQAKFLHPIVPPCTVNCSVNNIKKYARAELKIDNELCACLEWQYVYE